MPSAVLSAQLVTGAVAPLTEIVRAAALTAPGAPTPCAGWDRAALVRHLLYWAPFLAAAGRQTRPVPVADRERDVDLTDWPGALQAAWSDVAAAWSRPAAWEGTTSMAGPDPRPATLIGGMVLGELVVHGSDLARTAGVQPRWPADVLTATREAVAGLAGEARAMGIFGPEVPVPATAPLLDRTLGLAGRDPAWTA
jgi:uncharacterized protein (TIGR03086 family)